MNEEQKRQWQWLVERAEMVEAERQHLGLSAFVMQVECLTISPELVVALQEELEALREDAWKYRDLAR